MENLANREYIRNEFKKNLVGESEENGLLRRCVTVLSETCTDNINTYKRRKRPQQKNPQ